MDFVLFLAMIVVWIWSVARGIQVSLLCAILNFLFPPISQGAFAIYEEKMRAPFFLILALAALAYFISGETIVFESAAN